jgi:hypothetical protein
MKDDSHLASGMTRVGIRWIASLAVFIRFSFRYRASCTWISYKSTLRLLGRHLFRGEPLGCLRANSECSDGCWSSCELLSPSVGRTHDFSTCLLWLLINGDTKSTQPAESWKSKKGQRAPSSSHAASWAKLTKEGSLH